LGRLADDCQVPLFGHTTVGALSFSRPSPDCDYDAQELGSPIVATGLAFSPIIDLTVIPAPITLSLNYSLETAGDGDFAVFGVAVNADYNDLAILASNGGGELADPSGGWQSLRLDLSAYAGTQIRLTAAFQSTDETNNGGSGYYIDDLAICTGDYPTPTPIGTGPTPSPNASADWNIYE